MKWAAYYFFRIYWHHCLAAASLLLRNCFNGNFHLIWIKSWRPLHLFNLRMLRLNLLNAKIWHSNQKRKILVIFSKYSLSPKWNILLETRAMKHWHALFSKNFLKLLNKVFYEKHPWDYCWLFWISLKSF